MKKKIITAVIIVLVLALAALAICYFLGVFNTGYIGKPAARAAALGELGITEAQASKVDCDFEKEHGYAYYKVEIVYNAMEYDYSIDALTGEIKNVQSESVFD